MATLIRGRRVRLALVGLLLLGVVAYHTLAAPVDVRLHLAFGAELRALDVSGVLVELTRDEGKAVRAHVDPPQGRLPPVYGLPAMQLPRGHYRARVRVEPRLGGGVLGLVRVFDLDLDEDGDVVLSLDRADMGDEGGRDEGALP